MSKPDMNSRRRLAVAGMASHDAIDIVNEFYDTPNQDFEYTNVKVCILAERIAVAEKHREELREQNRKLQALNSRAMAIITDAIMHGMPITEDVSDVRNQIVCRKTERVMK